jgi:SAM-dependent methyltransferase
MSTTEQDVIDYIGQDDEPYDRAIQRYDHARRRVILRRLLASTERGRVLDLGCSNGSWYGFFESLGFAEIHGVELAEHRGKLAAERGYKVYVGRGQETPYEDGYFDAIVNQDVLVHVLQEADRRDMIREAFRVLKPGGTYVLTIPSARAEKRRRWVNRYTGYDLLVRAKHALLGRQGRGERLPLDEFTRTEDMGPLVASLAEIGLHVQEEVGHCFYLGDITSNLVFIQRLLDATLARLWPRGASVVFVKSTK